MLALAILYAATATAAEPGGGEELVSLIVNLLSDKDKDVRALGLEQVRTAAKGSAATQQFAAQLARLPADAQVGLLSALADRGDTVARPAVQALLTATRDEAVREAAIRALGSLGEVADLPTLLSWLTSGTPAVQAAARSSLVRLQDPAVPRAMAAELKRAAPSLRVMLIGILASRRALDTIPDLLAAAVDADSSGRAAAMSALGQLAGPEHIPGLVQGVLRAEQGREREAAEKSVMLVCARIAEVPKQAEPLLAAMDRLNPSDRMALLPTLGRVGGAAALKLVEGAIADAEPARHEAGLRAVCNWPDASVADRLAALVQADAHPEHRTAALRALIRIAPLADGRTAAEKLALLQKAWTLCTRTAERNLVLQRAAAIRTVATLRFLLPYLDQPSYAQQACEAVVELAHHRELREPHKPEFHRALDRVISISQDATVRDRAKRYQQGQTWARPTTPDRP